MSSVQGIYTRTVHHHLGYRPVWLPGTPLAVGDVGTIRDETFHKITTLGALDLTFEVEEDSVADESFDLVSATGCTIDTKASGTVAAGFKALGKMDAGARVSMSSKRSVLLQLRGTRHHRIKDQAALHRDLLRAVLLEDERVRWDRAWTVITDVVVAGSGTVAVASDRGAELELKATAATVFTSLADVEAGFSPVHQSNVGFRVIAHEGMTALYKAVRIKPSFWLGIDRIRTARMAPPEPTEALEEVGPLEDEADDALDPAPGEERTDAAATL